MQTSQFLFETDQPAESAPTPDSAFLNQMPLQKQAVFIQNILFGEKQPAWQAATDEAMALFGRSPLLRPDDPTDLLLDWLCEQPPGWLDTHRDALESVLEKLLTCRRPLSETEEIALLNLKMLTANSRAGLSPHFLRQRQRTLSLSAEDELDLYLICAKIEEREQEERSLSIFGEADWFSPKFEVDPFQKPHLLPFALYLNAKKAPADGLFALEMFEREQGKPEEWLYRYLEPYLRKCLESLLESGGENSFQKFKNFRALLNENGWVAELIDRSLAHPTLETAAANYQAFLESALSKNSENANHAQFEGCVHA